MPIIAIVADMIFESKIRATAGALSISIDTFRTVASAAPHMPSASAMLLDLTALGDDAVVQIQRMREAHPSLRLIAFLPHVQADLARAARSAGCEVVPRSKFSEDLPNLLARLAGVEPPTT